MLGLSHEPEDVAKVLLAGTPTPTDLLAVLLGDTPPRFVAGSVYAGVDAVAGEIVDKIRWMPKKLQYPYASVRALASYKPVAVRVVVDGEEHTFQAATVIVANSAYYGSGIMIAPPASVHDGLLDVIVIEAASRRGLIQSLPKAYDGSHIELDEVHVLQGRSVALSGSPSVPMGGDGEPLGTLPGPSEAAARVDVVPDALNILLPGRSNPTNAHL
jgi:diacylglycerol kinase family enzyme